MTGLLLAGLLLLCPPARAQEEEKSPLTKRLWDGFVERHEGKLTTRGFSHFYDNHGTDRDTRHHFFELSLDSKFKYAAKGNTAEARAIVSGATLTDGYSRVLTPARDRDRARNYIELKEAFYTREFSKADVTLGKRVIPMGICTLYSPSDRLNQADLNDPSAPRTLGVWQAWTNAYVGDSTLSFAYLPVPQSAKYPSPRTRWVGRADSSSGAVDYSYSTDESVEIQDSIPAVGAKNTQFLLKGKTTLKGWDVFGAAYRGLAQQSVIKRERVNILTNRLVKSYIHVWHLSTGFSTTFKGVEVHSEALAQRSALRRDDDFINATLGGSYTFEDDWVQAMKLEGITFNQEYAREFFIRPQRHDGYLQSSKLARAGRDTWLTQIKFKVSDDLSLQTANVYDHVDGGHTEAYGVEYRIRSGLVLKSWLEFFGGPTSSALGRWAKCDRTILQLEYSL